MSRVSAHSRAKTQHQPQEAPSIQDQSCEKVPTVLDPQCESSPQPASRCHEHEHAQLHRSRSGYPQATERRPKRTELVVRAPGPAVARRRTILVEIPETPARASRPSRCISPLFPCPLRLAVGRVKALLNYPKLREERQQSCTCMCNARHVPRASPRSLPCQHIQHRQRKPSCFSDVIHHLRKKHLHRHRRCRRGDVQVSCSVECRLG